MKQDADRVLKESTSLLFFPSRDEIDVIGQLIRDSSTNFQKVEIICNRGEDFEKDSKQSLQTLLRVPENSDWGRIFDALVDAARDKEGFIFQAFVPDDISLRDSSRVIRIMVQAGIIWKGTGKVFLVIIAQGDWMQLW